MKRLAVAVVVVAALALYPGALAAKVPSGKYRGTIHSGFLKGRWMLDFYRRGSFRVRGPFGRNTGKTRFRGSTVTFYGETGLEAVCHGKAGKYRYRLTRTRLRLRPISDPCRPRRIMTGRTWRKVR
jgi:hypothetical protein